MGDNQAMCECGHVRVFHEERPPGGCLGFKVLDEANFEPCDCPAFRPVAALACEREAQ